MKGTKNSAMKILNIKSISYEYSLDRNISKRKIMVLLFEIFSYRLYSKISKSDQRVI